MVFLRTVINQKSRGFYTYHKHSLLQVGWPNIGSLDPGAVMRMGLEFYMLKFFLPGEMRCQKAFMCLLSRLQKFLFVAGVFLLSTMGFITIEPPFGEYDYQVVVSNIFDFHHYLGKIPNLTNIFQRGWNHQLDYVLLFPSSLITNPSFMNGWFEW